MSKDTTLGRMTRVVHAELMRRARLSGRSFVEEVGLAVFPAVNTPVNKTGGVNTDSVNRTSAAVESAVNREDEDDGLRYDRFEDAP